MNRLTPSFALSTVKPFSQHIFTNQPIRLLATCAVLLVALGVSAAPSSAERPPGQGFQGYLDEAPYGIDARYAWGIPGGNGQNVTIFDVELSWGIGTDPDTGDSTYLYPGPPTHDDLSSAHGAPVLFPPGDDCSIPGAENQAQEQSDHGTMVLGELIADNDGVGVTGISWGAGIGLVTVCKPGTSAHTGNAIRRASEEAEPGDVILVEWQAKVCNLPQYNSLGPVEWEPDAFAAIQDAVVAGVVVVEAAGNEAVDLDQPACNGWFDRDQQDSGAIMVGAGQPPGSTRMATRSGPLLSTDGAREVFSDYGSRVDLQGWGSQVDTTHDPEGYATNFDGTSSAAPMVAGAAANLQSIAIEHWGWSLEPLYVRELLVETGAKPAGYDDSENIGPRPDLRGAIDKLFSDILLCGDMDGDLRRTKLDVESAKNCASTSRSPCVQLCDVDGDKTCTNTDAAMILEVARGASPKTLVCESPHFFGQGKSGGRGSLPLP